MNTDERDSIPQPESEEITVPVIEEQIVAGARAVKTGSVRVDKHVETHLRQVELPLLHEDVDVKRVAVNRVVKEAPPVRKNGDTLIVPVVEEQLVVSKRLVLKEEIHVTKRRRRERFVQEVEVEKERAEVQRLDASGRIVNSARDRSVLDRPVRRRTASE